MNNTYFATKEDLLTGRSRHGDRKNTKGDESGHIRNTTHDDFGPFDADSRFANTR